MRILEIGKRINCKSMFLKRHNLIFLFMLLANSYVYGSEISNPLTDFIEKGILNGTLYKGDQILTFSVDLNNDNIEDVFISSTNQGRISGHSGGRVWEYYISSSNNTYSHPTVSDANKKSRVDIVLAPTSVRVNSLDELNGRTALIELIPINAEKIQVMAHYLNENNKLITRSFGSINSKENKRSEKEQKMASQLWIGEKLNVKIINPESVMAPDQLSRFNREEDIFDKYYFVSDPNNPGVDLVYSKKTNKLVGHFDIRKGDKIQFLDKYQQ